MSMQAHVKTHSRPLGTQIGHRHTCVPYKPLCRTDHGAPPKYPPPPRVRDQLCLGLHIMILMHDGSGHPVLPSAGRGRRKQQGSAVHGHSATLGPRSKRQVGTSVCLSVCLRATGNAAACQPASGPAQARGARPAAAGQCARLPSQPRGTAWYAGQMHYGIRYVDSP